MCIISVVNLIWNFLATFKSIQKFCSTLYLYSDLNSYNIYLLLNGLLSKIIFLGLTDRPDCPRFPQVENIAHDSCLLSWKPPQNDGGSFITQYIVEKLELPGDKWHKACVSRFVCYVLYFSQILMMKMLSKFV